MYKVHYYHYTNLEWKVITCKNEKELAELIDQLEFNGCQWNLE